MLRRDLSTIERLQKTSLLRLQSSCGRDGKGLVDQGTRLLASRGCAHTPIGQFTSSPWSTSWQSRRSRYNLTDFRADSELCADDLGSGSGSGSTLELDEALQAIRRLPRGQRAYFSYEDPRIRGR